MGRGEEGGCSFFPHVSVFGHCAVQCQCVLSSDVGVAVAVANSAHAMMAAIAHTAFMLMSIEVVLMTLRCVLPAGQ